MAAKNNPGLRKRFEREAKLLARIHHPAIPYVLTTGVIPKPTVPYTVIQFIEGRHLRDELDKKKTLAPEPALRLIAEVLDALRAVHRERIIHRDIKPENIMLAGDRCMLIDFSIGFSLEQTPGVTRTTATGEHLGSVDYMCPEQRRDMARVDERCDLYAAAIVLLEMLTGSTRLAPDRMDAQLSHLAPGVRAVLKRACAEEVSERYQTAEEFLDALRPLTVARATLHNLKIPALCTNTCCPSADWSPRGYYRGPCVYEETKANHCGSCGALLKRHCARCGATYDSTRFCGECGTEWYAVPTCEKCRSWLQLNDMGTNTRDECCTKGRQKAVIAEAPPLPWPDGAPF